MTKGISEISASAVVHDAAEKVTGSLQYTGDIYRPGMLHMAFCLSPAAHGRIRSFDLKEAEACSGIIKIYTCFNTSSRPFNSAKRYDGHAIVEDELLFSPVLRFKGQFAAAVLAESETAARKAAGLIKMDIEPLPAVLSIEKALEEGAPPANDMVLGGNLITSVDVGYGDPDKIFKEDHQVFEDVRTTPAIHHLALEPHCVVAEYPEKRRLVIHSSTQNIFAVRMLLSDLLGLPRNRIQVLKPAMGGAFGSKIPMILEAYAALAALETGRPVRIELSRKETFLCTRTRHASRTRIRTAVSPEGKILAQDIEFALNAGAYCTQSVNVASAAAHKAVKLYKIPHFRISAKPVYTNLPVAGAMRGYGSPQLYFAVQSHLKRVADALSMDFVEFQLKNLIDPEDCSPVYGDPIGNPRVKDCVSRGRDLMNWTGSRIPGDDDFVRGRGMAVGMHGNGVFKVHVDFTGIRIRYNEDGSLVFHTPSHDMGNGSVTLQKMILSHELKIPMDLIEAVETDTQNCPWNLGDFASRGVFVSAEGARKSALMMRDLLLAEARVFWNLTEDEELELTEEGIIRPGKGDVLPLISLLTFIYQTRQFTPEVSGGHANAADRTSYGAHFAEVSVCRRSGAVRVTDYCAVHDSGKVLNRIGIEGQLEGAIQISTGYALCESMDFDEEGTLKNGNLKRYRVITAPEMPERIRMDFIEEGDLPGPYGAKSIGECSVVPGAPAIANAVASAVGAYPESLPIRREWVLEQLKKNKLYLPEEE